VALRASSYPNHSRAPICGIRTVSVDGTENGRSPASRPTPSPPQLTPTKKASDATRRYYTIAVDALGQEGFPFSPICSNPEWRPFYEPFEGDWHL
jgi:hypothetical protein